MSPLTWLASLRRSRSAPRIPHRSPVAVRVIARHEDFGERDLLQLATLFPGDELQIRDDETERGGPVPVRLRVTDAGVIEVVVWLSRSKYGNTHA